MNEKMNIDFNFNIERIENEEVRKLAALYRFLIGQYAVRATAEEAKVLKFAFEKFENALKINKSIN